MQMPSADLINFRFDKVEKTLEKFDIKLDHLGNTFETKEQAQEEYSQIWKELNALRANVKWWVATALAGITALAGVVYTVSQVVK